MDEFFERFKVSASIISFFCVITLISLIVGIICMIANPWMIIPFLAGMVFLGGVVAGLAVTGVGLLGRRREREYGSDGGGYESDYDEPYVPPTVGSQPPAGTFGPPMPVYPSYGNPFGSSAPRTYRDPLE